MIWNWKAARHKTRATQKKISIQINTTEKYKQLEETINLIIVIKWEWK